MPGFRLPGRFPELDTLKFRSSVGASFDDNLHYTVLDIGAYVLIVYAFRQAHASPEGAVVALLYVVACLLLPRYALASAGDGQHASHERDFYVFWFHSGEFDSDYEVAIFGQYFGSRGPRVRSGPRPLLIFRPKALAVHPILYLFHLVYKVHKIVKRLMHCAPPSTPKDLPESRISGPGDRPPYSSGVALVRLYPTNPFS